MGAERRINVSGLLTLAGLAGVWELTIAVHAIDFAYVPSPLAVARALGNQLESGDLLSASSHTVSTALIAWGLAMAAGMGIGVLLGSWARARAVLTTTIDALRTLPVIAFVPIAALLFGLSTRMEIVVAAWSALWPVLVNTAGAVAGVHTRLHEVGATLHLTAARRARSIVLPAAAPVILVGGRLALSLALIVTVAAEMIATPSGLGFQIVQMQQALQPDAMFAYIVTVGAIGAALNAALVTLAARAAGEVFRQGTAR